MYFGRPWVLCDWEHGLESLDILPTTPELAHRYRLRIGNDRCVDLGVEHHAGQLRLVGQVLGPDETGAVELASESIGASGAHVAPLNAGGEFHINGIRPGLYVLTMRLSGDDIVLPAFRIGAAPA